VAIIERLTGIGVVVWAFLAVAAPAFVFWIVLRRLRAAQKAAVVGELPRPAPEVTVGQSVELVGECAAAVCERSPRANSPLWWEIGDDPMNLAKPDPPDWVQRSDP